MLARIGVDTAEIEHFSDMNGSAMGACAFSEAEFCYVSWLCRCYIVCNEPQLAWETSTIDGFLTQVCRRLVGYPNFERSVLGCTEADFCYQM